MKMEPGSWKTATRVYRCDCFGYEICKRATCSKYTTTANIIPSKARPFKHELTPNAGICTDFTIFIDNVSGAENAPAEANTNTAESIQEDIKLPQSINESKQIKVVVHDVLNHIERQAHHIPDEEVEELRRIPTPFWMQRSKPMQSPLLPFKKVRNP